MAKNDLKILIVDHELTDEQRHFFRDNHLKVSPDLNNKGKLMLTSIPRGDNFFYELWEKYQKNPTQGFKSLPIIWDQEYNQLPPFLKEPIINQINNTNMEMILTCVSIQENAKGKTAQLSNEHLHPMEMNYVRPRVTVQVEVPRGSNLSIRSIHGWQELHMCNR